MARTRNINRGTSVKKITKQEIRKAQEEARILREEQSRLKRAERAERSKSRRIEKAERVRKEKIKKATNRTEAKFIRNFNLKRNVRERLARGDNSTAMENFLSLSYNERLEWRDKRIKVLPEWDDLPIEEDNIIIEEIKPSKKLYVITMLEAIPEFVKYVESPENPFPEGVTYKYSYNIGEIEGMNQVDTDTIYRNEVDITNERTEEVLIKNGFTKMFIDMSDYQESVMNKFDRQLAYLETELSNAKHLESLYVGPKEKVSRKTGRIYVPRAYKKFTENIRKIEDRINTINDRKESFEEHKNGESVYIPNEQKGILGALIKFYSLPESEQEEYDGILLHEVSNYSGFDKQIYYISLHFDIDEIEDDSEMFGYFSYEWPESIRDEALSHKFNDGYSALCAITCLFYNPEFLKYVENNLNERINKITGTTGKRGGIPVDTNNAESLDYFYFQTLYEIAGVVAYNAGMHFGFDVFTLKSIKAIHNQIAMELDIEFSVVYFNSNKNSTGKRYNYPVNIGEKIKRAKKIKDLPTFEVATIDEHAFNINDKKAREFLQKYVINEVELENGEIKKGYEFFTEKGDYRDHKIYASYVWGRTVFNRYMKMAQSNTEIMFDKVEQYFDKSKNIVEKPQMDKNYKGKRNRRTRLPPPLYASMDIEAFVNVEKYHTPYSASATFFNLKECLGLPLFKYSHKGGFTSDEIVDFFAMLGNYSVNKKVNKLRVFFHYGGKYDIPVLESYLLKSDRIDQFNYPSFGYKGAKSIKTTAGIIYFSFKIKFIDCVFEIVDSYRLLDTKVSELARTYGLNETENIKYSYPYCFYRKLKMSEDTKNEFTKDEMLNYMSDDKETIVTKNYGTRYVYVDYNNETERNEFHKFVNEYFSDNQIFDAKNYCEYYNNQDVLIVAKALIKADQVYQDLGMEEGITSLYGENRISILNSITLSSFVNSLGDGEKLYSPLSEDGTNPVFHSTPTNGLMDLYNQVCLGGIVHLIKDKSKRLFESTRISEIINHPRFYIHPNDPNYQELINFVVPYGYNVNKPMIPENSTIDEEFINMFELPGVCQAVVDANSLYPSSMARFKFGAGKYKPFTKEMWEKYDHSYLLNNTEPDENSNYTYVAKFKYTLGEKRISIPFIGVKKVHEAGFDNINDCGESGIILMDQNMVAMFKDAYSDSNLEFLRGVGTVVLDDRTSVFISKLYNARKKYKAYAYSEDESLRKKSSFQNVVKLLLNSFYGGLKKNEICYEDSYLSNKLDSNAYDHCLNYFHNYIYNHYKRKGSNSDEEFLYVKELDNYQTLREYIWKYSEEETKKNTNLSKINSALANISNFIYQYLYDRVQAKYPRENRKSRYEYVLSKKAGRHIKSCEFAKDSEGYTHISTFLNKYRDHKNRNDRACTVLSGSKIIMYNICKQIGFDNIFYTDTDSLLCDGSLILQPELQHLLWDKKGDYRENEDLGGFKSDFDGKMWDGSSLKPINKKIGLCSIYSCIVAKKKYCNVIIGLHKDGYMTLKFKKKCNGFSGDKITVQEYYNMLVNGTIHEQVTTDYKAFKVRNHRGVGLRDVKIEVKKAKAQDVIGNLI